MCNSLSLMTDEVVLQANQGGEVWAVLRPHESGGQRRVFEEFLDQRGNGFDVFPIRGHKPSTFYRIYATKLPTPPPPPITP